MQQTGAGVYTGTGVDGSVETLVGNDVVVLGGLFPVHHSIDTTCGDIFELGFQTLEAMVLAIETINSDSSLLPGVTLQFEIRDTCSQINTALEQSLKYVCTRGSESQVSSANETVPGVSGIVGAAFSRSSTAVARLLRLFQLPQISYASTANTLSDKLTFDFFLRTIPPDNLQALAIADIIEHFNWTYVIAIHTGDIYGKDGIKALTDELKKRTNNSSKTCVATLQSIELQIDASDEDYDKVVKEINQEWVRNSTVIVLFGQVETAVGMLTAVRKKRMTDPEFAKKNFTWIGSDGWGDKVLDLHDVAYGSFRVFPRSEKSDKFNNYFQSLNPSSYSANPWFYEYWEDFFNCTLRNGIGIGTCDLAHQNLSSEFGYQQDRFVSFTIDAVYAFAHAIHNLQKDFCHNGSGLCEEIMDTRSGGSIIRGDLLLKYLYNVSFTGISSEAIEFDKNGDRKGGYLIQNLQITSDGKFVYEVVGHWDELPLDRVSNLEIFGDIQWSHGNASTPVSICSLPCGGGTYPEPLPDQAECCWICRHCSGDSVVSTGLSCVECGLGEAPNNLKTECVTIQPTYLSWSHWWSIVVLLLTILGITATTAVTVVFIVYYRHKLIKASSRELTAVLLTGIMLCYLLPFFFIAKPSPWICGFRRFCVGFCFALCYSALLVKTNRIHRIFNRSPDSTQVPPLVSPQSQVFFTALLVAVQVVIASVWLIAEIPSVAYVYNKFTTELKCGESPYIGLSVTLGYNFLLLIVTTYFAFRTRKVPQNFNETKFISFTMYTLCVLWLAFIPTYFATTSVLGTVYETGSLTLTIILNATITLSILFLPKLYRLFFIKEKNSPSKSTGFATITVTLPTSIPPNSQREPSNVLTTTLDGEDNVESITDKASDDTYKNTAFEK